MHRRPNDDSSTSRKRRVNKGQPALRGSVGMCSCCEVALAPDSAWGSKKCKNSGWGASNNNYSGGWGESTGNQAWGGNN
jgi:hypothetical protein